MSTKHRNRSTLFVTGMAVLAVGLLVAGRGIAGSLDPTNAPGPTMRTMEEIYQKLAGGAAPSAGSLDPTNAPGPTMHTLQAIYDAIPPAQTLSATTAVVAAGYYAATNLTQVDTDLAAGNIATNVTIFGIAGTANTNGGGGSVYTSAVPKTGQTTSYAAHDDGWNSTNIGVAWPNPRFEAVAVSGSETNQIRDNLTGLIWARNANFAGGTKTWQEALNFIAATNASSTLYGGTNDWRLPNVEELHSLIDWQYVLPALANTAGTGQWTEGQPFAGVQSEYYWSSTTHVGDTNYAWLGYLNFGNIGNDLKASTTFHVWPVRGGQ